MANHATVRCFVGAFLEAESASRLHAAALAGLENRLGRRDVRQVPVENYHVTLKFLGATPESTLAQAVAAVQSLEATGSTGQSTRVVGFPRAVAARLLAAELTAQAELEAWWKALQSMFGAEERDFRPHVTVLRFHRPKRFAPLVFPAPVPVFLGPPRLYRSDQTADGVRYSALGPIA